MKTSIHKLRRRWDTQLELVMGYLGLFLVGAISWWCERLGAHDRPPVSRRPTERQPQESGY